MATWIVPSSDGESTEGEEFLPPTDVIVDLYRKIDRGEELKFDAKIYPRREPIVHIQEELEEKVLPKPVEKLSPKATEFDFTSQVDGDVKRFTPRRTPTKPQTKKVAKIENVFSDIIKYQNLENEKK